MAGVVVAFVLVLAGLWIGWKAVDDFGKGVGADTGVWMVALALISIAVKEGLYRWTRRVAAVSGSHALEANAWHHRSDALSSAAVLAGGAASMAGVPHADRVAGLVVAVMVAAAGARIAYSGLGELLDEGLDEGMLGTIRSCLDGHGQVKGWHKLRGRRVGRDVHVDVHVLVPPDLTVQQGHAVADELEMEIRSCVPERIHIVIHVEPFDEDDMMSMDDPTG